MAPICWIWPPPPERAGFIHPSPKGCPRRGGLRQITSPKKLVRVPTACWGKRWASRTASSYSSLLCLGKTVQTYLSFVQTHYMYIDIRARNAAFRWPLEDSPGVNLASLHPDPRARAPTSTTRNRVPSRVARKIPGCRTPCEMAVVAATAIVMFPTGRSGRGGLKPAPQPQDVRAISTG